MPTTRNTLIRPAAALALALALGSPARSADDHAAAAGPPPDTIVYEDGGEQKSRTDVVVESADWDAVAYKAGARSASQPGNTVVEVRWGDAPPEYAVGWRAVAGRDGAAARDAFNACLAAKAAGVVSRPWIDEYAQIGLGEACLLLAAAEKGKTSAAVDAFTAAQKANPKSLMADRILKGLAEAALIAGKPDEARKQSDALLSAGRTARRPEWEIDALFLRADIARQAKNPAEVSQAYEEAARVAEQQAGAARAPAERQRFERLRRRAAASAGWVLVDQALETKAPADFDRARDYFQGLPGKLGQVPEVLSSVENATGVIKLAAGDTFGALHHFQTTEVLHFGVPDEVARSLWYQAECWDKLGDTAQRDARLRDLRKYYPKSEWARRK